jgi:glucose-1-phosphate thymidylyltransferase
MSGLSILIDESEKHLGLSIPTRFQSFSEIRIGILNTIERAILENPNCIIYYKNPDELFTKAFLSRNSFIKPFAGEHIDRTITAKGYLPWNLISQVSRRINEDIELYKGTKKWRNKFKVKTDKYQVIGKNKHLYIHEDTNIYPNVVFDVSSGPVIIDRDVKITSFSFLEGPLYIGVGSHIDNARITGGTIIGSTCRIGGEVENSIIGNYSNKHHEGFIGHSFLGDWVNIGALATTSDLKNNYGVVQIQIGNDKIDTGTIKFGSIIGDFSKIAIGVMLNTGAVIDVGCNLVVPRHSGYASPFGWIDGSSKYKLDRFLNDVNKIMARRDKVMPNELEALIQKLYESQ